MLPLKRKGNKIIEIPRISFTTQNLLRSKQRKGELKKSVKISNKKPVKIA